MRFGSVCSGIEAASVAFGPLGWKAAWLAEVEPFPSVVLAHHYPDVPNLGDMTTLPARIASGEVDAPDVLCGGTPCQSWSVAGKRGGADDPRGQLTFSFLRIAEVSKPRFIVWENVPGILSVDKGRPFCQFLDGLLALGYVVNCDILDAQFFGLAQRRRRVFVVCQHASFLMKEKSNISVTIGAIAVLGILQNILAALHQESGSSPEKLAAKCANVRDGLERKIKCFSVQSEEILQTWLQNLAEAFLSAATDREYWELNLGPGTKTAANSSQSVGTQLSVFQDETASRSLCLSTSQSWKSELEDLFSALKSFTTLTELKAITAQKICIYAEMLHTIGWFIAQSKESCPHLLRLESLHSTLTKEFTKYARQADEPFFRGERFFGFWDDFSSKARASIGLIASARDGFDPAAVLFEWDGVRRDSAPRREAREESSGCAARSVALRGREGGATAELGDEIQNCLRASSGGGDKPHVLAFGGNNTAGPIDVATARNACASASASGRMDFESETFLVQPVCITGDVTHTLRGECFDASEDGTGRGQPIIVVHGTQDPCVSADTAFALGRNNGGENAIAFSCKDYGGDAGPISPTLRSMGHDGSHANAGGQVAVVLPFDTTQITSAANRSNQQPGDPCHPLAAGAHPPAIAFQERGRGDGVSLEIGGEVAYALTAPNGGGRAQERNILTPASQVRRLTPRECERLMGFPDDYTNIPWTEYRRLQRRAAKAGASYEAELRKRGKELRGKFFHGECPDGPRYKALGNSWAVTVVSWIGRRIQEAINGNS